MAGMNAIIVGDGSEDYRGYKIRPYSRSEHLFKIEGLDGLFTGPERAKTFIDGYIAAKDKADQGNKTLS